MHKKKHDQFKRLGINSRRGLRVGGVVIPTIPGYWGYGVNGYMSVSGEAAHEASETPAQEAAEHGAGGYEAGEGASMASGSGEAAGTSAGAGDAGGM
jgi:hypothetical protein